MSAAGKAIFLSYARRTADVLRDDPKNNAPLF
jgi:hypothetical protein